MAELSVTEGWDREMDEDQGMDRAQAQSKVDEVLDSLRATAGGLSKAIGRARVQLRMVSNDTPRPEPGDEPKPAPSGDSPLLNKLHSLDADLRRSRDQINSILDRLDI
jgi:hypothetical protein